MPTSELLVKLTRSHAIATVTLDRAARRNAINTPMIEELERVARSFVQDEQTRVVILRADGSDFSLGADFKEADLGGMSGKSLLMRRRLNERGAALMRALQEIPQPTICAVQGVATGAGACITTACDFRVGAMDARIGYGEVRLGLNLPWRALPLCVRLVGPARAKQMIMTGRLFDAATLRQWGFLDACASRETLDETARQWADDLAALPPIAVQMKKRSVDAVAGALDHAIMHMDADQSLLAGSSQDSHEAVSAFFGKRPATFTGE